jgi:hypothetical protein
MLTLSAEEGADDDDDGKEKADVAIDDELGGGD